MPESPMLDRARDPNGEISRDYGNTPIGVLRRAYGQDFGKGCSDEDKLRDMLPKLDEPSLSRLMIDLHDGQLAEAIRNASEV